MALTRVAKNQRVRKARRPRRRGSAPMPVRRRGGRDVVQVLRDPQDARAGLRGDPVQSPKGAETVATETPATRATSVMVLIG